MNSIECATPPCLNLQAFVLLDTHCYDLLYFSHEKQNETNGAMRPIYRTHDSGELYPYSHAARADYATSAGSTACRCSTGRLGSARRLLVRPAGAHRLAHLRGRRRFFLRFTAHLRVYHRSGVCRLACRRNRAQRRDYKRQNRPCLFGRLGDYVHNRNGVCGAHFDGIFARNDCFRRVFNRLRTIHPTQGRRPLRHSRTARKTPTHLYAIK